MLLPGELTWVQIFSVLFSPDFPSSLCFFIKVKADFFRTTKVTMNVSLVWKKVFTQNSFGCLTKAFAAFGKSPLEGQTLDLFECCLSSMEVSAADLRAGGAVLVLNDGSNEGRKEGIVALTKAVGIGSSWQEEVLTL